jgi:hypothetical protein
MKVLKIFLVFLLVMVLMGACTFWLRAKWNREYEQDELYKRSSELYEKSKENLAKEESARQALDQIGKDLESKLDQIDHDMFVLKYLIDEAYTYSEKPDKTEADKLILNALVEEINDMSAKLSGSSKVKLKITITVNGSIAEPREEIDKELEELE